MFYMKKFVRSVWRHYECCCLGNGHVRCSAFFKKSKLASWISCIYVVNKSIIFLLSYCRALGVDYFLKCSPYTKKFVRGPYGGITNVVVWAMGMFDVLLFFKKTKLVTVFMLLQTDKLSFF